MLKYKSQGFAIITTLLLLVVFLALIASHFAITSIEISAEGSSRNSTTAFYAAEAGLNFRAKEVRTTFEGFNRPFGVSPSNYKDCLAGNTGSGDFACVEKSFSSHKVLTYVVDETLGIPQITRIPPGERFAGLSAQEFRYTTYSTSLDKQDLPEAILALEFKSRVIPMFQFMAFYNKDLEFHPGAFMSGTGPIHVNGDIYLNSWDVLQLLGSISVSERDPNIVANDLGGNLYRGIKHLVNGAGDCDGTVEIATVLGDVTSVQPLSCNNVSQRRLVDETEILATWPEIISINNDFVEIPPPNTFVVGGQYWNQSDLRITFNANINPPQIEVRNANNNIDVARTNTLSQCQLLQDPADPITGLGAQNVIYMGNAGGNNTGPITISDSFNDRRENVNNYTLVNVDISSLLTCINNNNGLLGLGPAGSNVGLTDTTDGGLVFYVTVAANNLSNYGVRFYNGASLSNINANLQGLTLITNLPSYLQGDFNLGQLGDPNVNNWRPAAIFADTFNVLSNGWRDNNGPLTCAQGGAVANTTEANVAVLSGTDITGGQEGPGGWNGAASGGLHNYPRFHEDWSNNCPNQQTFSYRGSFVSLGTPNFASGQWRCCNINPYYRPPARDYGFDTRFQNVVNLPPLTPRVVYVTQELFERSFNEEGF